MDIAASLDMDLTSHQQQEEASAQAPPRFIHALPRLLGYFYPRVGGDRQTAEDLTQDTLLSAVRSGKMPGAADEYMPWLFAIARNKLIDHYRKQDRTRRNLGQQVPDEMLDDQPSIPDLDLESLPVRDEVITVLNQLNPRFQAVIVLRYFDGCDIATVAQALFLSESATQSLLARARNAFRSTWIARNGDVR